MQWNRGGKEGGIKFGLPENCLGLKLSFCQKIFVRLKCKISGSKKKLLFGENLRPKLKFRASRYLLRRKFAIFCPACCYLAHISAAVRECSCSPPPKF